MSGRLIFIGLSFFAFLSVVILVIYQFHQAKMYDNFATTEKLVDWVVNSAKNKEKAKMRLPVCLEPSMEISVSDVDSAFEMFWENVKIEDWSQTSIKNMSINDLQKNYTFAIKNIKNQKGEIGNRYFTVESRYKNRGFPILVQIFSQKYLCFQPNSFMNLDESYKWENPNPGVEKPEIKR
jgi:hypothetical protein